MKTISVAVSEADYEVFRQAARAQERPIAQLIREAMSVYRAERLEARTPLTEIPTLPGHRLIGQLPSRAEVYAEMFGERWTPGS